MTLQNFKDQLNSWGRNRTPFFFCIDFELEKPVAFALDGVDNPNLLFSINGFTNSAKPPLPKERIGVKGFKKIPITFSGYELKFNKVLWHLSYGDSFLTNLTIKTKIETDQTLSDIFHASSAKYKLLFDNQFLVFSPETFIQIRDEKIFSYPMKGTIDAAIENAEEKILSDQKEIAEHVTIVDLIRNDLSMIATDVNVARFRYIDTLTTNNKTLLQVSSEITGNLSHDWPSQLGDLLVSVLPAGSISGAPKQKTLEIIQQAEGEKRGYYTGVFGYFDGNSLDSGVMIRFIEKVDNQLYYRSGGGITTQSDAQTEYQEAIDKIYVPLT